MHTQTCVCACVYVLYICSCCCCQLLPLLPEFLKRFAYFINRKCSLRATDKNNCYCHCRFSLSLLQVPPFPSSPHPIAASTSAPTPIEAAAAALVRLGPLSLAAVVARFIVASQNIHNNNLVLIKIVPAFCYLFIWVNAIDNFTVSAKKQAKCFCPTSLLLITHTRTPQTHTHTTLSTRMHNSFISKHCIVFSHRHAHKHTTIIHTHTHTHV